MADERYDCGNGHSVPVGKNCDQCEANAKAEQARRKDG